MTNRKWPYVVSFVLIALIGLGFHLDAELMGMVGLGLITIFVVGCAVWLFGSLINDSLDQRQAIRERNAREAARSQVPEEINDDPSA